MVYGFLKLTGGDFLRYTTWQASVLLCFAIYSSFLYIRRYRFGR